ncbi:helix-turn-helix transcriptional regulator [Algoriphagus halophilus]|uniref:response regulator transcription factor n=1 Tax=Algoriphagus halophilus TaxID=226505 RepID=UPI00358E6A77
MDSEQTQLTPSEKKILRLIADGLSTKEIAEKLFIAERTVDKHRSNMIAKLKLEKSTIPYFFGHKKTKISSIEIVIFAFHIFKNRY